MWNCNFQKKKPRKRLNKAHCEGIKLERTTGIEPAYSAWEADILPMNYVRDYEKRSDLCRTRPVIGAGDRT